MLPEAKLLDHTWDKMVKLINILILSLVLFFGCSGPSRFISKEDLERAKKSRVDSLRIAGNLKKLNDTTNYSEQDLEFTEDEIASDLEGKDTEVNINLSDFLAKYKDNIESNIPTIQEKVVMSVISYMGTPYKYGGITRKGIDCSAFTLTVFKEALNYPLPRSAYQQYQVGEVVNSMDNLKFGDLVFFDTRRRQKPGHVGLYLWDKLFVHASTKNGVTISSLESGYYNQRYMGGRRFEELNLNQ